MKKDTLKSLIQRCYEDLARLRTREDLEAEIARTEGHPNLVIAAQLVIHAAIDELYPIKEPDKVTEENARLVRDKSFELIG